MLCRRWVASAVVMLGSERSVLLRCTTCDLLTEADKSSEWWRRARGFIAVSERGR